MTQQLAPALRLPKPKAKPRGGRSVVRFIGRRLGIGVLVLVGALFATYLLVALTANPLRDLATSSDPNKAHLIAERTARLRLDESVLVRFGAWFRGVIGYLWGDGSLGTTVRGDAQVANLMTGYIPVSVRLVATSVILGIVLGVGMGVVTALRQYSSLDYLASFVAFLFYAMPTFWVAVLFKQYAGIRLNDFLQEGHLSLLQAGIFGLVGGVLVAMVMTGRARRRATLGLIAGVAGAALALLLSGLGWFKAPGIGLVNTGPWAVPAGLLGMALIGGAGCWALAFLLNGPRHRAARRAVLVVAGLGVAAYYPLQFVFVGANLGRIVLCVAALGLTGAVVGYLLGGDDRVTVARSGALAGLLVALLAVADRIMRAWPSYMADPRVRGRAIATTGAVTPNLKGSIWLHGLDIATHLFLPTMVLVMIGFAAYTRFERAAMLEVLNSDYVRTARAKGLDERVVVLRHAFRSALIPLATLVPYDIAGMIGGAVIVENVFAWESVGTFFKRSLESGDVNGVMSVVLLSALTVVLCNIVVDLLYAWLDPRIKVAT